MTEHISWVNELAVKDGKLDTFRELTEEMVSGAKNQPGTLSYEWYISDDASTVHVVETYADSAAVVAHHVSEGFALKNSTAAGPCGFGRPPGVVFGPRRGIASSEGLITLVALAANRLLVTDDLAV